jgi:FAD:protein FMN transferase
LVSLSRNTEIAFFRAAFFALTLVLTGCATTPDLAWRRFEFRQPHMGVPFRIVLYATNDAHAKIAGDAAFARIADLNAKLSDYDLESELSKLSRTSGVGHFVPVSDDLWRVLEASQHWANRTGGAFDITVGPVVNLWRHARRMQQLPRPDRLSEMRARVGYTNLVLDPKNRSALLRVPEMRLDLGGIAKGFAADEALKTLREQGVARALVAAAGDIALGDPPPGSPGWKVEVDSGDTNAPSKVLLLSRAGVSTSGDLFQFLEIDGVRYSHIVDPHTGLGLTNSAVVAVIAPNGMTADALATAVSVLGPTEGLRLIKSTPRTAVRIVSEDVIEFPKEKFSAVERPTGDRSVSSGGIPVPAIR